MQPDAAVAAVHTEDALRDRRGTRCRSGMVRDTAPRVDWRQVGDLRRPRPSDRPLRRRRIPAARVGRPAATAQSRVSHAKVAWVRSTQNNTRYESHFVWQTDRRVNRRRTSPSRSRPGRGDRRASWANPDLCALARDGPMLRHLHFTCVLIEAEIHGGSGTIFIAAVDKPQPEETARAFC